MADRIRLYISFVIHQQKNREMNTVLKVLVCTVFIISDYADLSAQIEIHNKKTTLPEAPARIRSAEPYWIGAKRPQFHFDTSANAKVGLGTHFPLNQLPISETVFFEHAKLHVRHEGGPGSEFQSQKGPHLLLDEATADNAAVIRFRQSEVEAGMGITNELTLGARSWDLRGFANGSTLASDEFRLVNSGAQEDLITIDGDGNFKLSGEGNTRLEIKGPSDNQPVKLEFGEVGMAANSGRIWYNTSTGVMQVFSNGVASLTIDEGRVGIGSENPGDSKLYVDGYSRLGDHGNAPKIKTWYGQAFLPSNFNGVTNHNILPVNQSRILSVSIMVTNDEGLTVPPNFFEESYDSYYYYTIDGTTISLYTDDAIDVSSQDVLGKLARIFVTYTD